MMCMSGDPPGLTGKGPFLLALPVLEAPKHLSLRATGDKSPYFEGHPSSHACACVGITGHLRSPGF